MKDREDIGSLFEKRLNDATKVPKKELWDKINETLEAEEKKKRRFFLFWLTGGGIALLLILFMGIKTIGNPFDLPNENASERTTTENTLLKNKNASKEDVSTSEAATVSEKPSEENSELQGTKTSEPSEETETITIDASEEKKNQEHVILKGSNKSVSEKKPFKSETSGKKETTFDENYTVTKTYHYYNSETDQTITTHNKKTIDSILNTVKQLDTLVKNQKLEPLPIKKIDSF